MENVSEKRKHPRIETHVPVRYSKLKDGVSVKSKGSISKDFSLGGVCFRITEFVPMACRLIVELELPTREKPVKVIAKVAWIRKTTSGNNFELGNHFLEISKEDRDAIMECAGCFA